MTSTADNNTATAATSLEKRLQTARADVASLSRVSHRIALIDNSERLQQVLDKLLPRLLKRVGDNHQNKLQAVQEQNAEQLVAVYNDIHQKLVQLLSHILKRVRQDAACRLPCVAILQLLMTQPQQDTNDDEEEEPQVPVWNEHNDSLTTNLALTFLTLGVPRCCPATDLPDLLPLLLASQQVSVPNSNNKSQSHAVAVLLLQCLEQLVHHTTTSAAATTTGSTKNAPTRTTTSTADQATTSQNATNQNNNNNKKHAAVVRARRVLQSHPEIAGTVFDLFLDVLLFQQKSSSSASSLPPAGLSQAGHERLIGSSHNNSETTTTREDDWATAVFVKSPRRLEQLQRALLEFISPNRSWSLFLPPPTTTKNENTNTTAAATTSAISQPQPLNIDEELLLLGRARTVALLVVATAAGSTESAAASSSAVQERAKSLLKLYMDQRIRTTTTTTTTTTTSGGSSRSNGGAASGVFENNDNNGSSCQSSCSVSVSLVGHVPAFCGTLLSLCLGQTHAEATLQSVSTTAATTTAGSCCSYFNLGASSPLYNHPNTASTTTTTTTTGQALSPQIILSTKRRPVSSGHQAAIASFVASKILEDDPVVFLVDNNSRSTAGGSYWKNTSSIDNSHSNVVVKVLTRLAVPVAQRVLLGGSSNNATTTTVVATTGLSQQRARPYTSAAHLLNALSMRLATWYDTSTNDATSNAAGGGEGGAQQQQQQESHMARILATACAVLAPVASSTPQLYSSSSSNSHISAANSDGNLAVRDLCYGVICNLSRSSRFASLPQGFLFARGGGSDMIQQSSSSSAVVATAQLLFACAANEPERLRPRAVAALDSVLASYVRLYSNNSTQPQQQQQPPQPASAPVTTAAVENPWATTTTTAAPVVENPWATMTGAQTKTMNEKQPQQQQQSGSSSTSGGLPTSRSSLFTALLPIVWTAAQGHKPKASRVAAARWAGELLMKLQVTHACHVLCCLAGDADPTAASIARQGLGLPSDLMVASSSDDDIESTLPQLPAFGTFVNLVFGKHDESSLSSSVRYYHDFTFRAKAVALQFTLLCLLNDFYDAETTKEQEEASIQLYLWALTDSLADFKTTSRVGAGAGTAIDLLDQCSLCLVSLLGASAFARQQIISTNSTTSGSGNDGLSFGLADLKELALTASSSRARRHLAGACGKLLNDAAAVWRDAATGGQNALEDELVRVLAQCARIMWSHNLDQNSIVSLHGGAFLGGHAVKALCLHSSSDSNTTLSLEDCWKHAAVILDGLGRGTLHPEETVGNACTDAIAVAFGYNGNDAPILNPSLFPASTRLLEQITKANQKFSHSDTLNVPRVIKAAAAAGIALAATTTAPASADLGAVRLSCVDSLFNLLGSMAFRKEEEVAIAAGEAMAWYADAYCPTDNVWGTSASQSEWPSTAEHDETFAKGLPPHEHVLYTLIRREFTSSSPQKRTSVAPALLAVTARAAGGIVNGGASYSRRALVQSLLAHLDEVQAVFITLLSDPKSKHLSRESCCLGLAACRGLLQSPPAADGETTTRSANELNHRLLRAFGQTTNFGRSAMQETESQAVERRLAAGMEVDGESAAQAAVSAMETTGEVGGASGISEAALGAYREMASASASLGRHDILYALLILSVSHTFWFSSEARHRYSATALLGDSSFVGSNTNALEMKNALRPHLGSLIPRILRAKHDPNKQTREQMSSLWVGLTGGGAEARLAISLHLLPTIDSLIEETSSKLWRVRVGSCGALAEIIVGRDWASLGGGGPTLNDDDQYDTKMTCSIASVRLLRLWRAAMRTMDDVRGNVRESGATLARAVRGLTIRLCDPSIEEDSFQAKRGRGGNAPRESDTTAAAGTALRWLVRHGLKQHAEGTAICVSTLVEVVGLVNSKILEPILPDLIRSLLVAISGLEPSVFNYLQLRTNDQDSLERLRLQAAQQGPIAAAVSKCLDLTPGVATETQNQVVVELDSALRESPGFATRAATADAVGKLCSTCPGAFRFEKAGSANPAVRLLRAFYYACERERTVVSRDRLIHALGSLAALCPGSSVRSLVLKACQKYKRSTGNNDDPASRRAAAAALRSIAVRASNQLTGDSTGVWCNRVLPVAFVGRKDTDPKIAASWQDVWEEAGSAARSSGPSYGTTLEESLLEYLVRECTEALEDVSWARRVAGCSALIELCSMGILAPLKSSGSSATGTSKLRAEHRAKCCKAALGSCVTLVSKPRLWEGKTEAVKATSQLAGAWLAALTTESDPPVPKSITPITVVIPTGDNALGQVDEEMEESNTAEESKEKIEEKLDTEDEDFGESEPDHLEKESFEEESVPISLIFLCRLLIKKAISHPLRDAGDLVLPYREVCLDSLSFLLSQLPPKRDELSIALYELITPQLLQLAHSEKEAPVLIAAALDCIGESFWLDMGDPSGGASSHIEDLPNIQEIANRLAELGGKTQPAWTVREASAKCLAQLVSRMNPECFRQHRLISSVVDSASHSLKDRKYWRVRYAGLNLLRSLVQRAGLRTSGNAGHEKDSVGKVQAVVLEAVLPHKEQILGLVRSCLRDSESKITALSTDILSAMAWFP